MKAELIFDHPTETAHQRWQVLRRFEQIWYQRTMSPSPESASRIAALEETMGQPPPASIRELISIRSDSEPVAGWYYEPIVWVPDLKAVRIFAYDDDIYSVIRHQDFGLDDPPVHAYINEGEYGTDNHKFVHWYQQATALSVFHLESMMSGDTPNELEVEPSVNWLADMRCAFEVSASFFDAIVFEKTGLLVTSYRNPWDPEETISTQYIWKTSGFPFPACMAKYRANRR